MIHAERPGAHHSDRAGKCVLGGTLSHSIIAPRSQHLFIGLDGRTYVSDRFGVRLAARSLLARSLSVTGHRITGYRDGEVANG